MKKPVLVRIISELRLGGVEGRLVALLPRLLGRYEVHVVCLREKGELYETVGQLGVGVHYLPFRSRLDPRSVTRLARFLRAIRADIVHTHMYRCNTSGSISAWLAGVPVRIANVHNVDPWDSRRQILMERLTAPLKRAIVVVSEGVRENYVQRTGLERSRLRVIYNGVDCDVFTPHGAQADLGLRGRGPVVGTACRLVPQKNLDCLIRAASSLLQAGLDLRLAIVGDGPERTRLGELVGALDLEDSVTFAGLRRDMPDVLRSFDLFVNSSLREGFCNAIVEALATGLPVVATAVGGNPEAVSHMQSGLVVPPGQSEPLVGAMARLLSDPTLRQEMGGRARQVAVQRFSLEKMVEETTRLYDELLCRSDVPLVPSCHSAL